MEDKINKLTFPHQANKEKLLKYEKKLAKSPLTIFLAAVKKENLKLKVG